MAANASIAHVDGSGTGDNESIPATGPLGMGQMVSVEFAAMVSIPTLMFETVSCVMIALSPTIKSPAPEIAAKVVFPVFNCNAPMLITVFPA